MLPEGQICEALYYVLGTSDCLMQAQLPTAVRCGFRRDPAHPDANLMTVSEVAKILDAGKRAGCTEALFTFEEMPEEHSEFREWIEDIRYSSVIDYLIDLCKIAIEYGTLPHSNPDAMGPRDIRRLKPLNASKGVVAGSTRSPRL